MANILINGIKPVKGTFSVTQQLDINQDPPVLTILGQLSTHRYIEEITEIKTTRYHITGITVVQEAFGSDDFNIIYTFVADKLVMLGGESNLTKEEIDVKENELYGGDK